jgi:uncharacterized protein (TIGR02147 family)
MQQKPTKNSIILSSKGDHEFLIWLLLNSHSISNFFARILHEKRARRPRYSVRSLARALELSPAMTSQILSGKRGCSPQLLTKIARRLNLTSEEKSILEILSELGRARGKVKETLEHKLSEMRLSISQKTLHPEFMKGSHRNRWYFWALYSAFGIDGVDKTPVVLSKTLKLPTTLVEDTLKELCNLGWIRPGLEGHYALAEDRHQFFQSEFPPLELWELREHTLERIHKKIRDQSKHQEIGIAHFPFRPDLVKKVGEEMDRFVARLKKLAEPPEKATEVYCAYIHVYAPKGDHEG